MDAVRNLLASEPEKVLLDFLKTEPILAFDYDGTLAPIVKNAGQAQLRAKTRGLLQKLCHFYPCAILTGRSRADVLRHLVGLSFAQVLGNHGAEWEEDEPGDEVMIARCAQWKLMLEPSLGGLQGVQIEDKKLSLSVHYRKARRKHFTLEKIHGALKELTGSRIIGGKQVVNILPLEIGGKGQALIQLKKYYGKKTALFVGDDLNDEEVFELSPEERIFKVRVGISFASKADYYVPKQLQMDVLLELLLKHARARLTALEPVSVARSRSRQHPHKDSADFSPNFS